MKIFFVCLFMMSTLLSSSDVFARPKQKKFRLKDHPNYIKYQDDEEFRQGRSTRLTGILLTSIGGGVGGAAFLVGVLWNTCIGSSDEVRTTCQRNSRYMMGAGALVGGASLGAGIPMISVGAVKMGNARRKIDEAFPVNETTNGEVNEASVQNGNNLSAIGGKGVSENFSVAVRVLNYQF